MDKVTELQLLFDKLGISMLNSVGYLGILQAMEQQQLANPMADNQEANTNEGDSIKKEEQPPIQQPPNYASIYAKEIIEAVKRIDDYIDDLPGIESTQHDQIEELNALEIENNMLGEAIIQKITEAEQLKSKLNLALQELARDKVSGLQ